MTIYIQAFIECDRCHKVGDDRPYYFEAQAQEWADKNGWETIGDNHFCPTCKMLELDELEKGNQL